MTCLEYVKAKYPALFADGDEAFWSNNNYCPEVFGLRDPRFTDCNTFDTCRECWSQEAVVAGVSKIAPDGTVIMKNEKSGPVVTCLDYARSRDKDIPPDDAIFAYETGACPSDYGLKDIEDCGGPEGADCLACWRRKAEVDNADGPRILDSGNRRQFESGAVRDIQEGKGRCDLLPLDVVSAWLRDIVLRSIHLFQEDGRLNHLYVAMDDFCNNRDWPNSTAVLEVAIHFEEGAKKYGDNNWRKGIPVHCYIDSAVRHYLKFRRGDRDEPHDRAFLWNILCAIWTCQEYPELNDYCLKTVGRGTHTYSPVTINEAVKMFNEATKEVEE